MNMPKRKFDEQRVASLVIQHDDEPMNPREWDNLGKMACWHRRYTFGDIQPKEDSREWVKENVPKGSVVLPVFMMDHSGLTVSTSSASFRACDSAKGDWGQLGIIFATPEAIRKSFMVKRVTKKLKEKVEAILRSEVETYDLYLTGQCWGYVTTDAEGEEDSCWGFLGDTLENTGLKEALPDAAIPLLEAAWAART